MSRGRWFTLTKTGSVHLPPHEMRPLCNGLGRVSADAWEKNLRGMTLRERRSTLDIGFVQDERQARLRGFWFVIELQTTTRHQTQR